MQQVKRPASYTDALRAAESPISVNFHPGDPYADNKRQFQGIPGIERASNGRLWSAWYCGGQGESPLNYMTLFTSDDDGSSWTGPVLVVDGPDNIRACDGNIWLDPNGRLWLFWMQTHTLHDGRWGVWAITTDNPDDSRPAWSAPRRLADGIMLNKPTVLENGEWLFPISLLHAKVMRNEKRMLPAFLRTYLLALMSEEETRHVDERAGAWIYASRDRGETLEACGRAGAPYEVSTHNEHMVVERADGSLWMLLRTSYGIGQSVSTDGGATWSPVMESGIPHTSSRFFLRKLQSGNLLLVKHGPMVAEDEAGAPVKIPRNHLTAYLSEDDGKTWSGGLLLEDRGCTYPDGTQAPDGTIYVVYDHGRRGEKEVLMARFTEDDIRAGKATSRGSELKILINKATGVVPPEEDWNHFKGKDDPDEPLIFTGI